MFYFFNGNFKTESITLKQFFLFWINKLTPDALIPEKCNKNIFFCININPMYFIVITNKVNTGLLKT